jgi:phage terminase large subunit GpA-like protein
VWFLTAGVDVQDDEVYAVVRGWGDQRTSWLVDWWLLEREQGDDGDLVKTDLGCLEEIVLQRVFNLALPGAVNPRGRSQLSVALLCIDGNHRTMDVHNWRQSLSERVRTRTRIVRGELSVKAQQQYRMTQLSHSKRDPQQVYEGGLEMWHVNVDVFKNDLAQRFRAAPDKPGAWLVTSDTMDAGQFYLKQVVNEPQVLVRGKDGRWKATWRERDTTVGHDYWDCEIYASVAAQMVVDSFAGGGGWDAANWPKPEPKKDSRRKVAGRLEVIGER